MKREIICEKCEVKKRKLFPNENPYPGEHIKFVKGKAEKELICDGCTDYNPIHKGENCCAVSIWADYGGIPYYQWESQFIIET